MGSDYVWPRGSTEQLKAALDANGGTLVGADFFPFGTQDFRAGLLEDQER